MMENTERDAPLVSVEVAHSPHLSSSSPSQQHRAHSAAHAPSARWESHNEPHNSSSNSSMSELVPFLQRVRSHKLPPSSFTLAPAVPLPLWQRIVVSSIGVRHESLQTQHKFKQVRQNLSKELVRYHVELQERAERQRQQQREARARAGERVSLTVQKYWQRRGDAFQQLMKVEFDVVKHQHDRRKQEDLLRETEALTRKLLESFFAASNKKATDTNAEGVGGANSTAAAAVARTSGILAGSLALHDASTLGEEPVVPISSTNASETSFWAKVGDDDDAPIENALSLLDTEKGTRPLRHYQRSSLRWMVHLYENNLNGILADEMGLGKTVQTIALLCYFAEYRNDWGPHLIVVPTTVVLNWKAELDRWAPGLKVLTYIGSAKERLQLRKGWMSEDAFHVCVTSYNLIVQDRKVFRRRPWGFLVLDEAHQVKNFMSIKWQSLFDLQAEYRLLLTGTPLQNSIMELWSLFHFLLPFASAFRSNTEFKEWFSNPMDAMITGRSTLNEGIVRRLQALLRPFMLRRLKKDVEAQLPTKTERVVLCHLSRRQRALYDDYMQMAETKQKLRGGGAGGVLSVLLALRKVCDHPDLFEERPTISPLVLGYEAQMELTVPRAVLLRGQGLRRESLCAGQRSFPSFYVCDVNADDGLGMEAKAIDEGDAAANIHFPVPRTGSREREVLFSLCVTDAATAATRDMAPWWAVQQAVDLPHVSGDGAMRAFAERFKPAPCVRGQDETNESPVQPKRSSALPSTRCDSLTLQRTFQAVLQQTQHTAAARARHTALAQQKRYHIMQTARNSHIPPICRLVLRQTVMAKQFPPLCPTIAARVAALFPVVEKVCVYVPAVLATRPPRLRWLLPISESSPFAPPDRAACASLIGFAAKAQDALSRDVEAPRTCYDGSFFLQELWPIQVRRSFSFPDKRLLIHDCGKLQFLETALKELRQEGHRALIFTQFVHMLNILERFLALIGVVYMRLDGSTKAELRQQLVDRFNADARITCMILSTRSGGVGLNLTGADTVIFYDSDWNPTMDLQAQDRCHRIGQTRPVTIYRLISEYTVEESILQKARERKKLNNVVIRGGQFHSIAGVSEQYDDSAAAFAALSDPVNLRGFFHDLDEDATVAAADAASPSSARNTASAEHSHDSTKPRLSPTEGSNAADTAPTTAITTTAPATTASQPFSMLEEMAKVEDEEDRAAGQEVQREIEECEAREAAAQVDDDTLESQEGDDNEDDEETNERDEKEKSKNESSRKRVRFDLDGGVFTGGTSQPLRDAPTNPAVQQCRRASSSAGRAWRRKGRNRILDLYLAPGDVPAAPTSSTLSSEQGDGACETFADEAPGESTAANTEQMVARMVRKRQREIVRKAPMPVDQLLTLQYGRCRREDAEERYGGLVASYQAQMEAADSQDSSDEEEDEEEKSEVKETRLPPFHAMYQLGSP